LSHNEIQQLCTNLDATEPEFIMGSLYGLRQWRLHTLPQRSYLAGHFSHQWDLSGVNVATCGRSTEWIYQTIEIASDFLSVPFEQLLSFHVDRFFHQHPRATHARIALAVTMSDIPPQEYVVANPALDLGGNPLPLPVFGQSPFPWKVAPDNGRWTVDGLYPRNDTFSVRITGSVPIEPHEATLPSCQCGFYAYTDQQSLVENSGLDGTLVFGLVRAFGKVTQGTKGFRAEKAQVIALTRPQVVPPSRRTPFHRKTDRTIDLWETLHNPMSDFAFDQIVPEDLQTYETLGELIAASEPFLDPAQM
jgi:hypothetical protein